MSTPTPTTRPPLTGIELVLRNQAILGWLALAELDDGRLPNTRNTLTDLHLGYASFLGCDLSEVDIAAAYLDPSLRDWLWSRFGRQISGQSWGLDSAGLRQTCADSDL